MTILVSEANFQIERARSGLADGDQLDPVCSAKVFRWVERRQRAEVALGVLFAHHGLEC